MNTKLIAIFLFFITIESCHIHGSFSRIPKKILLTAVRNLHTEKNQLNKTIPKQPEITPEVFGPLTEEESRIINLLEISEKNIINDINRLTLKAKKLTKNLLSMEDISKLVDLEIATKDFRKH